MRTTTEYLQLAKAIANAPSIPPCMVTDPEVWFADVEQGFNYTRDAKRLCQGCPVITECLIYALKSKEEHGVWGGTTAKERQRLSSRARIRRRVA